MDEVDRRDGQSSSNTRRSIEGREEEKAAEILDDGVNPGRTRCFGLCIDKIEVI